VHQETNAARKLTVEQRREKNTKRTTEDTTSGVHASVYRVGRLDDPAIRFKVERNCEQLHMTGCVVVCKDVNIVVVEGGPKQQKKFRRLMLHRIAWNRAAKDQMDDGERQNEWHVDTFSLL
jgi:U4/U6 small nuclear ribonucleoprotein PRP3